MTSRLLLQHIWGWCRAIPFPRQLISAVILGALAISGMLAMQMLGPARPVQALPGQILAWDIARSAASSTGVEIASGAYIPGDRMVLYIRTSQTDRAIIRTWVLMQIEPFADRLAKMPERESLTWVIDFGPTPSQQESLTVPLHRVIDPAAYQYISAAPSMLANSEPDQNAAPPPNSAANPPTDQAALAPGGIILLNTSFDPAESNPSPWLPLSGDWAINAGIYSQRDNTGYDSISMLDLAPQADYRLETKLRLGEGKMGGGFIYNAPDKTTRAGAQNVDLDQQGSILRWGRYDTKGAYVYQGSIKLDKPINDGQWHTLRLVSHAGLSVVALDGRELASITNSSIQGYYGLTTSITKVDFDSVEVTTLPATAKPATVP